MVSRGEDPGEYRRLHRDLISLFQPADPFASQLLAELTEAWWEKVRRLRLGCEGPLEEAGIRRLDARIECRLMALTHALSLLSRKWYYGLTRVFGGRISSYKTLRVKVEARLRAFHELVPPPRRKRRGNGAASRQNKGSLNFGKRSRYLTENKGNALKSDKKGS
jgi:hypothetical protein